MRGTDRNIIKKKLKPDDLDALIKKEKNFRVLKRLYFVKLRYLGDSVEMAAEKVGVTKKTGYNWQEKWNKDAYEALIPHFKGGRKSKLSDEEKIDLRISLETLDQWTTKEVFELIKTKYGVHYSLKQIREILKGFGMKCSKPYCFDYRKPKDADEILKKT